MADVDADVPRIGPRGSRRTRGRRAAGVRRPRRGRRATARRCSGRGGCRRSGRRASRGRSSRRRSATRRRTRTGRRGTGARRARRAAPGGRRDRRAAACRARTTTAEDALLHGAADSGPRRRGRRGRGARQPRAGGRGRGPPRVTEEQRCIRHQAQEPCGEQGCAKRTSVRIAVTLARQRLPVVGMMWLLLAYPRRTGLAREGARCADRGMAGRPSGGGGPGRARRSGAPVGGDAGDARFVMSRHPL